MKKKFFYLFTIIFFIVQNAFASEELLILFDFSVSMADKLGSEAKYKIAANETKKFLDTLNPSSLIGLRVIGIVLDSNIINYLKNFNELCTATKLLVPINSNNIENIKNGLNSLLPLGMTPLEYSLDSAIKYDFSSTASLKHIILVTDGVDGCNGDPCRYIKELMQYRNDIKIDIIALGVAAEDLEQLKCITNSTHGAVINVDTPEKLKTAYTTLFTPQTKLPVQKNVDDIMYKNYLMEIYE